MNIVAIRAQENQDAPVTVVVNAREIQARVAQRRQQEFAGVDLWVTLDSHERRRAASEISAVVSRGSGDGPGLWRVYPTTGGTYAWLDDAADWEGQVERLAEDLALLGHTGSISIPPVDVWPTLTADRPYPTAVTAHRMEPPITEGPFNVMGMPEYRWGVGDSASAALLSYATTWACLPDTRAQVGEVAFIPVTSEDASDILDLLLTQGARRLQLAALAVPQAGLRRSVRFESFGQSAWVDLDDDADPLGTAEGLTRLLVELAPDLDVALVHPTYPGLDETSRTTTGIWNLNRHLWSSFVPDAFGIQLLTSAHLERAHDLSDWRVDEVAPDRWIVRSRDLGAWFQVPDDSALRQERFPDVSTRAKARADFGEMILTRAAAKANPRPTPQ